MVFSPFTYSLYNEYNAIATLFDKYGNKNVPPSKITDF